jgi:hypothetical protein
MPSAAITAAAQWQATRQEAALRTHRHDHRVLHLLGFYQAQDFGAEVFFTVGPAQATTSNVAEAQVHAFDARRVTKISNFGTGFGSSGIRCGLNLKLK